MACKAWTWCLAQLSAQWMTLPGTTAAPHLSTQHYSSMTACSYHNLSRVGMAWLHSLLVKLRGKRQREMLLFFERMFFTHFKIWENILTSLKLGCILQSLTFYNHDEHDDFFSFRGIQRSSVLISGILEVTKYSVWYNRCCSKFPIKVPSLPGAEMVRNGSRMSKRETYAGNSLASFHKINENSPG